MPIYAYKCGSCGHAKDVLQKMSDAPLTTCPACGAHAFTKQVTAAGFQLKGSGWYATDFRGGTPASAPADEKGDSKSGDSKSGDAKSGESKSGDAKSADAKSGDSKPADKAAVTTAAKPAESKAKPAEGGASKTGTPPASAGG